MGKKDERNYSNMYGHNTNNKTLKEQKTTLNLITKKIMLSLKSKNM